MRAREGGPGGVYAYFPGSNKCYEAHSVPRIAGARARRLLRSFPRSQETPDR